MEFLYLLEGLRNPVLDAIMAAVTELGGELAFLIVALVLFWCVDKRHGYYLMAVGFFGTVSNQFLKITCRVPRPWVRDPSFTIVEAARADAVGYSFPSGHSTSSVATYGALATMTKKPWLRKLFIGLCVLIPFTRLYLGVHYPNDVLFGASISMIFIGLLRPVVYQDDGKNLPTLFAVMLALSAAFVGYMELFPFPADTDPSNLASAVKNSYTLLGVLVGMTIVYYVDKKWDFPIDGCWYVQVIKVVGGLVLALAVKEGLKAPLDALFGGHMIARTIRYFALVLTAGILWPMTFPWLKKLGRKDEAV